MRPTSIPAGLLCFAAAALAAQSPWPAILAEHFGYLEKDGVLLVVRGGDQAAYLVQDDDLLLRLRAEGQLLISPLPKEEEQALWTARRWGGAAHWVLVDAQGQELADGAAPPSGEAVVAFLGARGVKPRWEAREAFLQAHPDHGEAWDDAVWKGFTLARLRLRVLQAKGQVARVPGGPTQAILFQPYQTFTAPTPELREAQADQVFGEVVRALEGQRKVEGCLDHAVGNVLTALKLASAGTSPAFRAFCAHVLADLEAFVQVEPEGSQARNWSLVSTLAGDSPGRLPRDVVPLPGRIWPTLPFLIGGVRNFLGASDWDGALAFLAGAEPLAAPGPAGSEGWDQARAAHVAGALAKVLPLLQLGRETEALAAIEEARRGSGSHWPAPLSDPQVWTFLLQDPTLTAKVRAALTAPPLPDPPAPPAQPPLRLVLLGQPPWREAWGRLRQGEELLPWGPGELVWGTLDGDPGEALRAQRAWGPEPRWVLVRGGDVLGSGRTCPSAGALADLLSAQGPSALQRLDAILERRPDHRAARRARLALLEARMPEPRLEARLVEDERLALHGDDAKAPLLTFGPEAPWHPDPALWQWAALQMLPVLQARLERWPGSPSLWLDWVAWSRFHPAKPSPVALARSLTFWERPRTAELPPSVHKAVAQALRARGDLKGLSEWLWEAWEAMPRTPAADYTEENWNGFARESLKDLGEAVVKPLEEVLTALGRSTEAREVERTFRTLSVRP